MIRIGEAWWRVILTEDISAARAAECRPEDNTIAVRVAGYTENQILSSMLHETVHATVPDLGEDAVLRLESSLMQAYDWICENVKEKP